MNQGEAIAPGYSITLLNHSMSNRMSKRSGEYAKKNGKPEENSQAIFTSEHHIHHRLTITGNKNNNHFSVSISRITNEFGFTGGRRLVAEGADSYSAIDFINIFNLT